MIDPLTSVIAPAAMVEGPIPRRGPSRVRAELDEATRRGYVAARRMLGAPDLARDACQEAAARALRAADRYDPTQPFYPWFYRILKNHCLDRLRRRGREVSVDEAMLPAPPGAGLEERALAGERERAVTAAIARLDDDLREIIELRHFQDASYEEMALALEIPVGTVMSRLYRARKKLRAALPPEMGRGRR